MFDYNVPHILHMSVPLLKRIAVVSDVDSLEEFSFYLDTLDKDIECICIVGNVKPLFPVLRLSKTKVEMVTFTPGTRDYSDSLDDAHLKTICEDLGIVFLQERAIQVKDLKIIGCTLWTPDVNLGAYEHHLKWLQDKCDSVQPDVIVTHYAPVDSPCLRPISYSKETVKSLYAPDIGYKILDECPSIKLWVFGGLKLQGSLNIDIDKYLITNSLTHAPEYHCTRLLKDYLKIIDQKPASLRSFMKAYEKEKDI